MAHLRWPSGRFWLALVPLLVGCGLTGPGSATASAAGCQAWTGAQPPSPGTADNQLTGVTVLSPCDAWAVGSSTPAAA